MSSLISVCEFYGGLQKLYTKVHANVSSFDNVSLACDFPGQTNMETWNRLPDGERVRDLVRDRREVVAVSVSCRAPAPGKGSEQVIMDRDLDQTCSDWLLELGPVFCVRSSFSITPLEEHRCSCMVDFLLLADLQDLFKTLCLRRGRRIELQEAKGE